MAMRLSLTRSAPAQWVTTHPLRASVLGVVLISTVLATGCSDPELQTHKQWVRDLRAQLATKQSQLTTAQTRITTLASELTAAKEQQQALAGKLNATTDTVAKLEDESTAIASQLGNLIASLRVLGKQAGIIQAADAAPASLVAALAANGQAREQERQGALAAAAQSAAEVIALTRARDYLEQRVKALSDVDSESAQVPGARIFRERERQLRSQLTALAAANQYLQRQARRLVLDRDVANAGIAQARQQTAALNQSKLYLQQQIDQLNGTAAAQARAAADDLAVNLADALAQRDALQTEAEALQGDVRRLEKTSESLAVQFETARQSLQVLRGQSAGNLKALAKAQQDAITLRGKFDAEENNRNALRTHVKEVLAARDKAQQALTTATAKIERMQAMLDTAAAQQTEMQSNAKTLTQTNSRLKQMLDTAAAQAAQQEDATTALAQSQKRLTDTQTALAKAEKFHQEAMVKALEKQQAALHKAAAQHATALAAMRQELIQTKASMTATLKETEGARDTTQEALTTARGQLQDLEAAFKKAQDTRDEALALSEQLAQRLTRNTKQIVDLRTANAALQKQIDSAPERVSSGGNATGG